MESRQWDTALGIPDSRPFIFSGVCGGQDGLSLGLSPLVTWTGQCCIKFGEPQLTFAFRVSLRIQMGSLWYKGLLQKATCQAPATAEQIWIGGRNNPPQAWSREVFRVRTKAQLHPHCLADLAPVCGRAEKSTQPLPSSHFLTE